MSGAFEHKILTVSQSKQAGLLGPAKIAASKPDTGITIVKKSAYFVIRDCAKITEKYLVHHVWGEIKNPIDICHWIRNVLVKTQTYYQTDNVPF